MFVGVDEFPFEVNIFVDHINAKVLHFKVVQHHKITNQQRLVVLLVVSRGADLALLNLRQQFVVMIVDSRIEWRLKLRMLLKLFFS